MSEFAGNVTGAGENPVVSASKGHFFVPIDDQNYASKRKQVIVTICLVVLAVVLLVIGIVVDYHLMDRTTPPQMFELGKRIGVPTRVLSWREKTVRYANVKFNIVTLDEDGEFTGFVYTTAKPLHGNDVLSVASALAQRFCHNDGKFSDIQPGDLTTDDLRLLLTEHQTSYCWSWSFEQGYTPELAPEVLHLDVYITPSEITRGKYEIRMVVDARPNGTDAIWHNQ